MTHSDILGGLMAYFNNRKNVNEYIQMAEGYDGRALIAVLQRYLPAGSTVLELGMGPGKDLELLAETYTVTGSDSSSVFLELYREKHPTADLLELDATSIDTDRTFECIYSNKVLHHLSRADLPQSFARQRELLSAGGLLLHSFWVGDHEEEYDGLRFVYYTEEALLSAVGPGFEVVVMERYTEMEEDDSFFVLLRKM